MANFERELSTYSEKLPELKVHTGKYVLIKADSIEGIFDSYSDALKAGYTKFKLDSFLVKQIAPIEAVHYFTRDLEAVCR